MNGAITTEYDYMQEERRVIFIIDSKSFYASLENVERGLNPLKTDLVVMPEQPNMTGRLVMVATSTAKKMVLTISNATRQKQVRVATGVYLT